MNRISKHRKAFRRAQRGMTLIEIMVVITILGLIAAAVAVNVFGSLKTAKIERAKMDIHEIQNALKLYYTQKGKFPDTGAGLQALIDGKQLESVPKDPWGNSYVYTLESGKPQIVTYGADGAPGGQDDDADISSKDLDNTNSGK